MSYIIYGVFIVGGILSIIKAVKDYFKTIELLDHGIETKAEVIEVIRKKDSGGDAFWYPVFEYYDESNIKKVHESDEGADPPVYKVGQKMSIIYDPFDAQKLKVKSFWGLYRVSLIFGVVGSVMVVSAIVYLLSR